MRNEKGENVPTPKRTNSLFNFVLCELKRGYVLQKDEQRYEERREKLYASLKIPQKLEMFILYGFFQCADAFLFVLTFLPFRFILSILLLFFRIFKSLLRIFTSFERVQTFSILHPAETCDLLKGFIIICCVYLMNTCVDTSMIYHIIKSQSVIKLYIFFNMLEVADKLLSSVGQDILDTLYWTATEPRSKKSQFLMILFHFIVAVFYVFFHTLLVLLQATTLNVAINSKNKALLTVMMSNNFVELKSMVFKKFEKSNLFHMSCSDVRERFHYIILLLVVIIQTMKEYSWSEKQFWILLPDCLWVLLAEMMVDYFKHIFVTRFNDISYDVYEDYSLSIAYDLVGSKLKSAFSDHSDVISRRMGFIPLPLAILLIRIFFGSFIFIDTYSCLCLLFTFLSLITFKLAVNIVLIGFSCDLIEHRRALDEEKINKTLGQSTSLPASRHNSVTDLTILDQDENQPKFTEIREKIIEQNNADKQTKGNVSLGTRSTPHSPSASPRNSLEDIPEQVALLQGGLESPIILSDSTVSLISMNDGQNLKLPEDILQKENVPKSKLKVGSPNKKKFSFSNAFKRRVSLQELPNNVHQHTYAQCSNDNPQRGDKQLDGSEDCKEKTS